MSDALTTDAPETDPVAAASVGTPPGDGTAVDDGSAESAETNVVDAKRFNGLMSAHQRALDALTAEREARIALEARLQDQGANQNVTTDNDAVLAELQATRAELAAQRLETAKASALAKYPDAAPFADLIVGDNASEIESVAAAIATRMADVKQSLGVTTPPAGDAADAAATAAAEEAAATAATTAATTTVPVATGGEQAPGEPNNRSELLNAALQEGSWDKFWQAKASPDAANNLA